MSRFQMLDGKIADEVTNYLCAFSDQQQCEIGELNVLNDHVHLLVMVPPKISISDYIRKLKGRTAI